MDSEQHTSGDPRGPAAAGPPWARDIAALTRRLVEGDEMAYRVFHHQYFARHTPGEHPHERGKNADGELGDALAQSVTCLASAEKDLITWKYEEQRSVRCIAARLQTTEKAVESRLARIRLKLKRAVLAVLKDAQHGT